MEVSEVDSKTIKAILAYGGVSQATVARAIGITPQSFGDKLARGTLSDSELLKIAELTGSEYIPAAFVFPDGRKF